MITIDRTRTVFFHSFAILIFSVSIFLPKFVYALDTIPVIGSVSSQDLILDGPITLVVSGENFGSSKGQVINLDTNAILNVASGGEVNDGWTVNSIRIFYPNIPAPDAFRIGENRIVVRTAAGLESDQFTITGRRRGSAIISSITPTTIHLDEEIVINGSGFGLNEITGEVGILKNYPEQMFTDSQQKIISWSDAQIRVKFSYLKEGYDNIIVLARAPVSASAIFSNAFPVHIVNKPLCSSDSWSCGDWNACSISSTQTRNCTKTFDCPSADTSSPSISQSCTYVAPTCSSWTYSNWSSCSEAGQQTRTIASSSPSGCAGGNPVLNQSCTYVPSCTANSWQCGDWNSCSVDGKQARSCNKVGTCEGGVASPTTTQNCTYVPSCNADTWACGDWNQCSVSGTQSRSCTKSFDCPTASTPSPTTSQNCTPPQPTCNADTWTCGGWDACSLSGIQNRSCTKSFDCPSVETAPPTISQYCEAPNKPTQQTPPTDSGEVTNQDTIVKATVKLLCPVDARMASQGSGTIIDPSGTILTNKHVIAGTVGCFVGFVDSFGDDPYFGDRQIADIAKTSPSQDIAVLKLRNPQNKRLPSVNIAGASSNLRLGTRVVTYGYPASFGRNMTYTSGDFSGSDGAYLKTTAIIEHGNSGGGAYLTNGTYIGIPSMVRKGELNALGYILSINTINAWLNNSGIAYSGEGNNQYSRVSVLEDMDLKQLGSLKLFIPETDATGALVRPVTPVKIPEVPKVKVIEQQKVVEKPKVDQKTPKVVEKVQPNKPQEESKVIEATNENKAEVAPQQNQVEPEKEQKPKKALPKRFFSWLSGLFSRWAR